jgi:transcriptional regulator with XRE-family HTH domain
MKKISQKIKELRNENGYTQNSLAQEVGVSARSIFGYEAGEKVPRPGTVVKLAKALGVSTKYLNDDNLNDPADEDKEKYVNEAASRYGEQGARDIQALLNDNIALFAGGEISQSEKDTFFEAVMRAYIKCKDESMARFTRQSTNNNQE